MNVEYSQGIWENYLPQFEVIQVVTTYCFYWEFIIQQIQAHRHQPVDTVSAGVLSRYAGLIRSCPQMNKAFGERSTKKSNKSTVSKQIYFFPKTFIFSWGSKCDVCVCVQVPLEVRGRENVGGPLIMSCPVWVLRAKLWSSGSTLLSAP